MEKVTLTPSSKKCFTGGDKKGNNEVEFMFSVNKSIPS
jgi:hypothetical protein